MIALLLLGVASALPTRSAAALPVGTQIVDVVVSNDGSTVAVLDGGGSAFVLDMGTWDLISANPCSNIGGITAAPGEDGRFWAGCGSGEIAWFELKSGAIKQGSTPVELTDQEIIGMAANDTLVFGLAANPVSEGNPQIHAYNPVDESVLTGGFPSTLSYKSVDDMEANANFLFLSHGGASFSKVASGSGGATRQQGAPGAAETADVELVGASRVFVAGGRSGVLEFQTGSNILSLQLSDDAGVESATAIAANSDEGWFAIADDEQGEILFHTLETSVGAPTGELLGSFEFASIDGAVREFGIIDGYLFAGTDIGDLHVMTDRPWVEASPATPAAALDGETVTIQFTADTSGDWSARRGASTNGGGNQIASGTVTAGQPATASFVIGSAFKEGDNVVRIVVTDEDGNKGHDSTEVNVDNPPTGVSLTSGDVGFGDKRIIIELDGIDDEDLSHYKVFASSVPFERSDYPVEGPEFMGVEGDVGAGALNLPRRVNASPGKDKTITIEPLTNGVTYYVAIRAYDEAGQESAMSTVVSETPRETFGAADLAGEKGGHACSSVAAPAAGFLALLGGLFACGRRSGVMAAVIGLTMVSGAAHAEVDSEWPQKGKTVDDFIGRTFEVRYGGMDLSDKNIQQIFGTSGHNVLWLKYGWTAFDLAEFTGSLGYYKDTGVRVDAAGNASAEKDTIKVVPLTVDATFRLDVLPEQFIVPFAGIGYDYWLWEETWTGGGSMDGGKSGTHTTLGFNLLLDVFQPSRASLLKARTGITDSYITIEWRSQVVGGDSGLSFSGDALTFGLKLDH